VSEAELFVANMVSNASSIASTEASFVGLPSLDNAFVKVADAAGSFTNASRIANAKSPSMCMDLAEKSCKSAGSNHVTAPRASRTTLTSKGIWS
jgi:hypothetical protein